MGQVVNVWSETILNYPNTELYTSYITVLHPLKLTAIVLVERLYNLQQPRMSSGLELVILWEDLWGILLVSLADVVILSTLGIVEGEEDTS